MWLEGVRQDPLAQIVHWRDSFASRNQHWRTILLTGARLVCVCVCVCVGHRLRFFFSNQVLGAFGIACGREPSEAVTTLPVPAGEGFL